VALAGEIPHAYNAGALGARVQERSSVTRMRGSIPVPLVPVILNGIEVESGRERNNQIDFEP